MRKKAIAYAFLVRLLIAVIAIVTVVIIATTLGKGLFKKTAAAEESFEDFAVKVEEAKQWKENDLKKLRVDMDEDDSIWFFNKGSTDIQKTEGNKQTYVKRPSVSECSGKESCLCLCRKSSTKSIEGAYDELNCDELYKCKKVVNVTFKTPATDDLKYVGGLVIESDSAAMKLVFVEKGSGNLIGICEERISSCLE